ncbi:MAG TPA: histidine phosphatase family protein [Acidothermaceae bacterium]|jgi:broad specificity phosphatase PhoE|nr:histidine phosphatase family protein [Acidothermaceae bacterium]
MTTRTVVHLLRHGEVDNPAGVLYGRLPNYHLSEAGVLMAKRAAAALEGHDIVLIVSSPLERALETATPVAEQFELQIRTDDRLIEPTNFFEGRTFGVGDGALRHPANWRHLVNPFRPSWGEPYAEVAARVLAAVTTARDAARGHEAVCVSHQLPIWTARRKIERKRLWHDPRRRQCALGSLTSLVFDDDDVVAVRYLEPSGAAGAGEVGGA